MSLVRFRLEAWIDIRVKIRAMAFVFTLLSFFVRFRTTQAKGEYHIIYSTIMEEDNMEYTLKDLPIGSWGYVQKLKINGTIRRRLLDMGLVKGSQIICLGASPMGGLRAYQICGAVVALRDEIGAEVIIDRPRRCGDGQ